MAAVENLFRALGQPVTELDRADGWTDEMRESFRRGFSEVRDELAEGWGVRCEHAAHHLLRARDFMGVNTPRSKGALNLLAIEAQNALLSFEPLAPYA